MVYRQGDENNVPNLNSLMAGMCVAGEANIISDWTQESRMLDTSLPLTSACVQECLRLYPPFFIIGREAKHDCSVLGESFKRGENLLVSAWVTQRDPRYHERPGEFMPERFLKTNKIERFSYFPFGVGARTCVAQLLLKRLLPVVTAKFIQRFNFQQTAHTIVRPHPRLTLGFTHPVMLQVIKRATPLVHTRLDSI